MTPRRLAALEALAARGATEGERAAARNALDAYKAEQAKQREQAQSRQRTRPPFNNATEAGRLFDKLFHAQVFAQEYNTVFYNPPYHQRSPFRTRYQDGPVNVPKDEPAPAGPRVTQMRRATAADFPDLPIASADPSNPDVLVVECTTTAQMWERFTSEWPWRVLWQGFVWDAPKPCGVLHDRAKMRFYVKVDRRQLREVTVPV